MPTAALVLELIAGPGPTLEAVVVNRSTAPVEVRHGHPDAPCRLELRDARGRLIDSFVEVDPAASPPKSARAVTLAPGGRLVLHREKFRGPSREGGWALAWGTAQFKGGPAGLRAGRYRARVFWGALSAPEVELRLGKARDGRA